MGNGEPRELSFEELLAEQLENQKEKLNDLLGAHFRPAKDAGEALMMWTTDMLFTKIEEHSPELIPKPALRGALLALGYQEEFIGDQFVWLLIPA